MSRINGGGGLGPVNVRPIEPQVLPDDVRERAALACRQRIESSLRTVASAFYELSMGLLEAYENNYPALWGFRNFRAYVEEHLDMKYRRAIYLVDVARALKNAGVERGRAERIGWTKLKEISGPMQERPEEAPRLLELAGSTSSRELKRRLKADNADQTSPSPEALRLSARFEGPSQRLMEDALAMAYAELGCQDPARGLAHIAAAWLRAQDAGHIRASPEAATEPEDLDAEIARLEARYGVRLQALEEAERLEALLGKPDPEEGARHFDSDEDVETLLGLRG